MPPTICVTPRDYIHSEDYAALENLKQIPLFESCLKAFMKIANERFFHGQNMAQKIRLGPKQLPDIHKLLFPACQILGIDEPELYLEMNPAPNAYTMGDARPFVSLTSGLIELLTVDELQAVIAHECGHIACRHVLYHTMAQMLLQFGSQILGPFAAMATPVFSALMYWYRRSELSCDRAAAIVSKRPEPVVQTMIRLAGGPKSITSQINVELYLQQADAYDKLLESTWDKLLQGMSLRYMNHPWLAVRAREVSKWCQTEQFQRIIGALDGTKKPQCANCHMEIQENWKFCRHCSAALQLLPPSKTTERLPP